MFNTGDLIKLKFTDFYGMIVREDLSQTGEKIYEVLWDESSLTSYCLSESLLLLKKADDKTVN